MSRFFAALGGEGGMAPPEEERAERLRLEATLYELERVEPWEAVTAEALEALKERCRRRLAYLALAPGARRRAERTAVAASAPGALPAGVPAAAGTGAGVTGAATPEAAPTQVTPTPAPPGPGLREFLAERSILIVSYVGAFLLIVATLLFELAAETFGGPVRFAGVLALDLVFGAAAWLCWRSPRLRIVGTTYLAIFALIAPLVFVAAYVFFVLREQGVSVSLMVTVGAVSCAALYGTLAARLRSAGYATLSALAVLTAWCGALVAVGLGEWGGAGLTPLVPLLSLFAFGARGSSGAGANRRAPREWMALPPAVAETFIHATAALALGWTALGTLEGLLGGSPDAAGRWAMTLTLGGLAAGYAAYGWLAARWWVTPLVAALTSLTVLAATAALETEWWVPSLSLLALAWAYAALAERLPVGPAQWARTALRALAALQAAVCAIVPATPDALQTAIVLAAAALGVFLAWSTSRVDTGAGVKPRGGQWWLSYAAALFSLGWYWLVKLIVPPPERPTFLGLLTAYAPLPVLLAGVALAVSRRRGRTWALPVYVVAAANAAWIVVGLAAERDGVVPGWTYLVYAVVVYAVAWLEPFPAGAPALAALATAGAASLLR
ncbi:MAG TPA: hypothetical protein VFN74_24350, partial [Chloroflexota bacterium]|nr:hypothetical protein [Chloroflexota bacterium]